MEIPYNPGQTLKNNKNFTEIHQLYLSISEMLKENGVRSQLEMRPWKKNLKKGARKDVFFLSDQWF